jgi:hypothetical protein
MNTFRILNHGRYPEDHDHSRDLMRIKILKAIPRRNDRMSLHPPPLFAQHRSPKKKKEEKEGGEMEHYIQDLGDH